ncbi:MAG TPA: hypothetical protein VGL75_09350 [Acidothermaceae bacterium]|jgi:hypothetical protein
MLVSEAIEAHGVDVFDYLARDAEVPLVTRAAAQGDVFVLRVTTKAATETPITKKGVQVVRGENGGNTHSLHGDGFVDFKNDTSRANLVICTLTVPEGGQAVLAHPEHGFLEIAPGTYAISRQREQADEIRMVAD